MMLMIRLALRNARRNLRRTTLTAATVVLGTAIITLAMSWVNGIFGQLTDLYAALTGPIRVVDADFAAREALQPLYENIEDAEPMLAALRAVDGVVTAEPRIATGVVITASEEIGDDVAMLVGGTDRYYRDYLEGPKLLIAGTWLTGAPREVVLGRKVAIQAEAQVGDEVLLLGQTQYGSMSPISATVVGVVTSDGMVDNQAYVPLEEARWLLDLPEGALEILVYGRSNDAKVLGPLMERIRALPEMEGYAVEAWYQRDPWATIMGFIGALRGMVGFVFTFVTALAIFNTMTMSVLERTGEIGVMRAMGLTRVGAVGMFLTEALFIGFLGGLGGAFLGSLPIWYLEVHGVHVGNVGEQMGEAFPFRSTFYPDLTPEIFANTVLLGLVIALLGALLPALRAAFVQPVVAMKARR